MSRISANKLGEYLITTSPTRRRRIIFDQKHPSGLIVPRYRLADEPLAACLESGGDKAEIDRAVVRLRADATGTAWAVEDRRNTAAALDAVLGLLHKLPFGDVSYVRGPERAPHLRISGVNVSVAPNFLLFFQHRGTACVGAMKLHYPKSDDSALERAGGEYVAALIYRWLAEYGPQGRKLMPSHCISVDVFRRAVVVAPNAQARRMGDISAACQEIDAHWQQM